MSDIEGISTEDLKVELARRDVEDRMKQIASAALTSAEEGLALVVDTYYETLEKSDSSLKANRDVHDERLLDSLNTILNAYWEMNRDTWKRENNIDTLNHSRPANFTELASFISKGRSILP
jgi:hypothetical protein